MIVLKLNENRFNRIHGLEIKLSEITQDTSGITLHFRHYEGKPFTAEQGIKTREQLQKIFPDHFVETYQLKITLGKFIDIIDRIY